MTNEIKALRRLSAKIGVDPLLIQAAGGNTSIKQNGVMWIKASGTWLSDAETDEIFVPVHLEALLRALGEGDPRADNGVAFVDQERNPKALRPSIETTVHAVFAQKIVVHVHCVNTIAIAIRQDAEQVIAERLKGQNWAFVPYIRPGAPLSRAIAKAKSEETNVMILGNHGLIVAGDSVADVEALLYDIVGKLAASGQNKTPDIDRLKALAGPDYAPASDKQTHQLALQDNTIKQAIGGSLYPDHVIFLGIGAACHNQDHENPPMLIVPDAGILLRKDASPGAIALARCLSDVLTRVPRETPLHYLSDAENDALINWDAEKYRQSLNAERDP